MTYKALADMVASVGLPCSYYQFPDDTPQAPPFICWIYPGRADFYGDDSNYQKIEKVQLELYTDVKNIAQEAAVEAVLSSYGFTWVRDEGFLDDEKMHLTTWNFDVVITPEAATENTTQEDVNNGQ